jgi:type I restriction enzyme S subunit
MGEWREVEFGKIPKEWDFLPIINIKSDEKHSIAMGPFGSNIKSENFVNSGIPVIRGNNFNYHKFISGDFVYLTEEKANELKGSICRSGDLVFTHRGTIGQVGLIPKRPYTHYVVSQSGMKLTVNQFLMDPEFLFYFFISKFGQYQILKYESQVGVPSISNPLTSLKQIEVPVPPLPEQKAIASLLSSLDDKIDLLHRQNKTLEAMAETLFRQGFVEGAEEDWEEKSLGELLTITSSKRIFYKEYVTSGVPFYRSKEIIELHNAGSTKSELFISLDRFEEIESKFGAPKKGDILLTSVGTLGVPYRVKNNERFYFKDGNLTWFKDFNGISSRIIYSWLKSQIGKEQLDSITIGSTQAALTISGLKELTLAIPPAEKINELDYQLNLIYEKVESNQNQISILEKLRDTSLPKLMSGEVRVEYTEN